MTSIKNPVRPMPCDHSLYKGQPKHVIGASPSNFGLRLKRIGTNVMCGPGAHG